MHTAISGVGAGLRLPHLPYIVEQQPELAWFELLADNHLNPHDHAELEAIREHYPMTMHGVNLSLGGLEPFDKAYLKQLKTLYHNLEISWYSEHLCFSHNAQHYSHDLLPLPYTEEALKHCIQRISELQNLWGERILIENLSTYIECQHNTLSEAEFINQVAEQADCYILLDVNNIYVNHINHGINATDYIKQINPQRIKEIHLAGHTTREGYLLDTHSGPVADPVWQLYKILIEHAPNTPSLIEWDNDIPAFPVLMAEVNKAKALNP